MSHFHFWRLYFYILSAFLIGVFGERTKEVSYWQEVDDSYCRGRSGRSLFKPQDYHLSHQRRSLNALQERNGSWGHMDSSLTSGEDTLLSEKWLERILAAVRIWLLVLLVPESICFIKLSRCPARSGLSALMAWKSVLKSPGAGMLGSRSPTNKW